MKTIPYLEEQFLADTSMDPLLSSSPLTAVFTENTGAYINPYMLFVVRFKHIPNQIEVQRIDCIKAEKWLNAHFGSEIKERYFSRHTYSGKNASDPDHVVYFLAPDLMVYLDTQAAAAVLLFRDTPHDKAENIAKGIQQFKRKRGRWKPEISLLINSFHGLDTKSMEITKPKLSIEDNYNDDFAAVHQTILKRLQKKNDKGLVLLHGRPGTGKTSYIRYLITAVKKEVIFLPPNMAAALSHPDLISLLMEHPNSILVIEDAENIIMDRDLEGRSPVSALLNISDGLLSDCLNIQLICSFNTDLSKIDTALLRKGRLIARYEFKELSTDKARQLSEKLGFQNKIDEPMTLTDIYNFDEKDFSEGREKQTIGFLNSGR